MTKLILFSFLTLLSAQVFAGDKVLNGGDICEDRLHAVRDDIRTWIQEGGANFLNLPNGLSLAEYKIRILQQMATAKVSCTNKTLTVDGNEKACINFVSRKNQHFVVCNRAAFNSTSDSDQYSLVHHEYAGLSAIEINHKGSSDYFVSNQLTNSLEDQTSKHLVVKDAAYSEKALKLAFGHFVGSANQDYRAQYKIVECKVTADPGAPSNIKQLCEFDSATLLFDNDSKTKLDTFAIEFSDSATKIKPYTVALITGDDRLSQGHGISKKPTVNGDYLTTFEVNLSKVAELTFLEDNRVSVSTKNEVTHYYKISLILKRIN